MAAEYDQTDTFRGASFTQADFTGATFRDCDLRQVTITDSWLVDVRLSGLVERMIVNDVDVTPYVTAELNRQHPERVQHEQMQTVDDHRAMWDTIERLWSDTLLRAGQLPESVLHERVEDGYSLSETLRHLTFAIDAWAGSTILEDPMPYHRLGVTFSGYPPEDATSLGLQLSARPSLTEAVEAHLSRMALVRGILDALTDTELERKCTRPPAPGYPNEERTVRRCLRVIMWEECEHHRYAVRDLAVLEARERGTG
jgi:DinB family protein/pentapeptide repeat protein